MSLHGPASARMLADSATASAVLSEVTFTERAYGLAWYARRVPAAVRVLVEAGVVAGTA